MLLTHILSAGMSGGAWHIPCSRRSNWNEEKLWVSFGIYNVALAHGLLSRWHVDLGLLA